VHVTVLRRVSGKFIFSLNADTVLTMRAVVVLPMLGADPIDALKSVIAAVTASAAPAKPLHIAVVVDVLAGLSIEEVMSAVEAATRVVFEPASQSWVASISLTQPPAEAGAAPASKRRRALEGDAESCAFLTLSVIPLHAKSLGLEAFLQSLPTTLRLTGSDGVTLVARSNWRFVPALGADPLFAPLFAPAGPAAVAAGDPASITALLASAIQRWVHTPDSAARRVGNAGDVYEVPLEAGGAVLRATTVAPTPACAGSGEATARSSSASSSSDQHVKAITPSGSCRLTRLLVVVPPILAPAMAAPAAATVRPWEAASAAASATAMSARGAGAELSEPPAALLSCYCKVLRYACSWPLDAEPCGDEGVATHPEDQAAAHKPVDHAEHPRPSAFDLLMASNEGSKAGASRKGHSFGSGAARGAPTAAVASAPRPAHTSGSGVAAAAGAGAPGISTGYGYAGSNLGALQAYATHPDRYPDVVVMHDASWVVVRDKYPKALIHLLVLPRRHPIGKAASSSGDGAAGSGGAEPACLSTALSGISTALDLTADHVPALLSMAAVARQAWDVACTELSTRLGTRVLAPATGGSSSGESSWASAARTLGLSPDSFERCRLGFHAVPSLQPLHCHVLSPDLHSDCLKNKKHYLSFTHPHFFLGLPAVVAALGRGDDMRGGPAHSSTMACTSRSSEGEPTVVLGRVGRARAEAAMKASLACCHCGKVQASIPALKAHLLLCLPGSAVLRTLPPAHAL